MKMLIVDNGPVYMYGGRLCINPQQGVFLSEVAGRQPGTYYASAIPSDVGPPRLATYPVEMPGLECVIFEMCNANRLTKSLSYLRAVPRVFDLTRRADFLYLFCPGNLSKLFAAAALLRRKHYGLYLRGASGFDSRWTRHVVSRAQFVIAAGEYFVRYAGQFCADVEPVVPMCHLPGHRAVVPREPKKRGPWRLLYVGDVVVQKGIPELLQAARVLVTRGLDFELNLVGANVMGLVAETLGELASRVFPVGPVTDQDTLERYYKEADLFCFPSHTEGFPRVLYEAMAFQVPIITTFVGGIPGTMTDGHDCLRVNVRDAQNLAETIERALLDAALRKRLADHALETVAPVLRRASQENHGTQLVRKVREHLGR